MAYSCVRSGLLNQMKISFMTHFLLAKIHGERAGIIRTGVDELSLALHRLPMGMGGNFSENQS
jgi:hypothetical protein